MTEIRHRETGDVLLRVESSTLIGIDLSELADKGLDLMYADLRGVCLDNADLRGVALVNADLAGASLRGADLRAASFDGADLTNADLSGVIYDDDTEWSDGDDPMAHGAPALEALNPGAALRQAAMHADVERVRRILAAGADVNSRNRMGVTALFFAADTRNPALIELLISAGADVNSADRDGWTPLMLAARVGDAAATRILLKYGARVNATDWQGMTPLHLAVLGVGHPNAREQLLMTIRVLLSHGANPRVLTNTESIHRQAPLDRARRTGWQELVELLEQAADALSKPGR